MQSSVLSLFLAGAAANSCKPYCYGKLGEKEALDCFDMDGKTNFCEMLCDNTPKDKCDYMCKNTLDGYAQEGSFCRTQKKPWVDFWNASKLQLCQDMCNHYDSDSSPARSLEQVEEAPVEASKQDVSEEIAQGAEVQYDDNDCKDHCQRYAMDHIQVTCFDYDGIVRFCERICDTTTSKNDCVSTCNNDADDYTEKGNYPPTPCEEDPKWWEDQRNYPFCPRVCDAWKPKSAARSLEQVKEAPVEASKQDVSEEIAQDAEVQYHGCKMSCYQLTEQKKYDSCFNMDGRTGFCEKVCDSTSSQDDCISTCDMHADDFTASGSICKMDGPAEDWWVNEKYHKLCPKVCNGWKPKSSSEQSALII